MDRAPSRVVELVETFDQHIEAYHSQQYNETQLRREFIEEIEKWRSMLARIIALRNPTLPAGEVIFVDWPCFFCAAWI